MRNRFVTNLCATAIAEEQRSKAARSEWFRNNPLEAKKRLGGLAKIYPISPVCSRYIVSLDGSPVGIENFKSRDPNIRATKGVFFIQYLSKRDKRRVKGRPYVILHDLFDFAVCVGSYSHLKRLAESIPEVKWLLEWTTFDPYLFSVARCHSGLCVPFTIDWRRYACHVFDGAKERGINLGGKAFMAYRCSQAAFDSEYSGLELAETPKPEDYAKVIAKSNARYSIDDDADAMADWGGKEPERYGDDR